MRRILIAPVVVVTTVGMLVAAPGAFAPPVPGVPNVNVTGSCFAYGHRIPVSGNGFAPRSSVVVSSPVGHYVGPTPVAQIRSVTITADGSGGILTHLVAPRVPKGLFHDYRWSYQPRVVFADGTAQTSGAPGQSFASIVIASRTVCRELDHPRR